MNIFAKATRCVPQKTIEALEAKLKLGDDGRLTGDAGEYVVSITAKEIIESELGYVKIPLGELRGKQSRRTQALTSTTKTRLIAC